ncbi:MAG: decaprenyl-phosphate phosphoribosyltransferase [Actinobacteria bacterium]|nr:MAG: decaprenyl-phosphate phosphoribosyltransferase [Actinomycetota bacterium]
MSAETADDMVAGRMSMPRGILKTARPKQWVKNALVFAGPVASGMLFEAGVIPRTLLTFLAFTLMASGVYFLNDSRDVVEDRAHPKKKYRPIAAGVIPVPLGYTLAGLGIGLGLALMAVVNADVFAMGVIYVLINVGYSLGLKNVAVVDLLIVAGGFMLRALAGAFAVPSAPSVWFNLMTLFGSLLLVSGKRSGERAEVGSDGATRKVQSKYTDSYLQFVREFSAAGLLMAYGLMAYQKSGIADGAAEVALQVSIIPFLATIMLLVQRMDSGGGASPEDLVLHDRGVQLAGAIWVICFMLGVYLGSGAVGV